MNDRLAGDLLLDCLAAEGVDAIFGNPGTTELPVIEAMAARDDMRFYLGLQEIVCLGMADGYAQATGRPAVVNLHASPGLGNAMGNFYNAWRTGSPVIVTAGQQDTRFNLQDPLLYSDMVQQARQYAKWAWEVRQPDEVPAAVRRCFAAALQPPTGPAFLSLPMDLMTGQASARPVPHGPVRLGRPHPADLTDAAALLNDAERPALIVGDRADRGGAVAATVRLAERLGARAWAEPMAQRLPFPPGHELFAGFLPPFGPLARAALEDADVIVVIGAEAFLLYPPFAEGPHLPPAAQVVHLDTDASEIGKNHPATVGLWGDLVLGTDELTALVKPNDSRRLAVCQRHRQEREQLSARARERQREPAHPASVAAGLSEVWRDRPLVEEAVSMTGPLQRSFPAAAPRERYAHRAGGLGWGVPAALGVAAARPAERTIAVIGDGAAMYAVQGLWTAAHYHLNLTVVVLDNGGYEIIRAGLRRQGGPAAASGVYLGTDLRAPSLDWGAVARSMGLGYRKAEQATDIADAAGELEHADGPGLLHVSCAGGFRLP